MLNIELDIFPECRNKQCNKLLHLLPGTRILACHHCNHTMGADKCSHVFHCMMSFEDKFLTLPVEVISILRNKISQQQHKNCHGTPLVATDIHSSFVYLIFFGVCLCFNYLNTTIGFYLVQHS